MLRFRAIKKSFLIVRRITSDHNYLPSTTRSVYVSSELDAEIDYSKFTQDATKIFKYTGKYVQPSEFQFQLPKCGTPEFAFVGRSNVGKSSLISALLDEDKLGILMVLYVHLILLS